MPVFIFDSGFKGWSKLWGLLYLRNRLLWHGWTVVVQVYYLVYRRCSTTQTFYYDQDILELAEALTSTLGYRPCILTSDEHLAAKLRTADYPVFCTRWHPRLRQLVEKAQRPGRGKASRAIARKKYAFAVLSSLVKWFCKVYKKYQPTVITPDTYLRTVDVVVNLNEKLLAERGYSPVQLISMPLRHDLVLVYDHKKRAFYRVDIEELEVWDQPYLVKHYRPVIRRGHIDYEFDRYIVQRCRIVYMRHRIGREEVEELIRECLAKTTQR